MMSNQYNTTAEAYIVSCSKVKTIDRHQLIGFFKNPRTIFTPTGIAFLVWSSTVMNLKALTKWKYHVHRT